MPSRFCWYELMTPDPEAAKAFYARVVGWGAMPSPVEGYTLLTADGMPVAGLMAPKDGQCSPDAKPGWLGYVAADDVDATAGAMTAQGATLVYPPTDIPGIGRFAVLADPQGAIFALFQPAAMPPPKDTPPFTPMHIGWHELHTPDKEAGFAFYAGHFGWTKGEALQIGPTETYQLYGIGETMLGGIMANLAQVQPHWLYYINVPDIDAATARIAEAGGKVLNGPHEVPGGAWITHGSDPQGAIFALVGPKAG